jgi:hypothetical protein
MGALILGYGLSGQKAERSSSVHQGASTQKTEFALPPSQAIDTDKPIRCVAIASASLIENLDHRGRLKGKITPGTDKLALQIKGDTLLVAVRGAFEQGVVEPDKYNITGHTVGFLSAVHEVTVIPHANSIVLNKQNGFAVWSLNEPMLVPGSEYPIAQAVYLRCSQ